MQKLCNHCEILYTPKENFRGSDQIYCSVKCRNNAAQKRMINKIRENAIQESETHRETARNINTLQRGNDSFESIGNNMDSSYVGIMEKNYEARNKINELELKNLYLSKELEQAKQDIINLELEIEESDSNSEEIEENGFIGNIMQQFKTDPVNTISFASELINNLLKPKANV